MQEPRQILDYQSSATGRRFRLTVRIVLFTIFGVVLLFTALAVVVTPRFTSGPDRKREQTIGQIRDVCTQLESFKSDVGRYPSSAEGLEALVKCPPRVREWHGPYFYKVPKDAWGGNFQYQYPVGGDPEVFSLLSSGGDGVFGTDDDLDQFNKN